MSKKLSDALYYLILLVCAILVILLIRFAKIYDIFCTILNILIPIFFGYVFAWILNPIYEKLSNKLNKNLAFVLIILSFILFYIGIILIIVPVITSELPNFMNIIEKYMEKLESIPFLKIKSDDLAFKFDDVLTSCGGLLSIVINFALINMFGFYILYNYSLIGPVFKKMISPRYKTTVIRFIRKLSSSMYQYVRGTLIDTSIMFVMTFILFTIFGLKYSLMLALFIAITNIIPFIGPYIGGVPAVLVGFSTSLRLGIITSLIVLICQLIESNIINPMIMSKVTKINPLILVITITIIGKIFGIIGMALAVPLLIFLKILYEFYLKYKSIEIIKKE